MVQSLNRSDALKASDWPEAVTLLRERLGDIHSCELPLQLLSVAVRKAHGDEAALLDLPLEMRKLLEGNSPGED
jgi:hypothetical protein